MKEVYKEIPQELLEQTKGKTWSIENMAAHDAADRPVEYIGSRREGNLLYDYYRDSAGAFWFKNRAVVNGEIVSMERYIFGREIAKKNKRTW